MSVKGPPVPGIARHQLVPSGPAGHFAALPAAAHPSHPPALLVCPSFPGMLASTPPHAATRGCIPGASATGHKLGQVGCAAFSGCTHTVFRRPQGGESGGSASAPPKGCGVLGGRVIPRHGHSAGGGGLKWDSQKGVGQGGAPNSSVEGSHVNFCPLRSCGNDCE